MSDKPLPGRQPGAWLQDFTRKSELEEKALDERLGTAPAPGAPAAAVPAPAKGGSRGKAKPAAASKAPAADKAQTDALRRLQQVQEENAGLKAKLAEATAQAGDAAKLQATAAEAQKLKAEVKALKAQAGQAEKVQGEAKALQARVTELEAAAAGTGSGPWTPLAIGLAAWGAVATVAAAVLAFV